MVSFVNAFQRFSPPVCFAALPASAYMPATSGDETLVPPIKNHPLYSYESYSATSTAATAEMSSPVRYLQPVSVCHAGFASCVSEQPAPARDQTTSVQPRLVPVSAVRSVPPTATTRWNVAGSTRPPV